MISGNRIKAMLLMNQGRFAQAEGMLREDVAADPDDAWLRQLLSTALCRQEKYAAALYEAGEAVRLAPDDADSYFVLAEVELHLGREKQALAAVERCLELNPDDPAHHALLAAVRADQGKWAACLAAAEAGLARDAEHPTCNHFRQVALTQSGRADEARDALAGALARDPQDDVTHCNLGWQLLRDGKPGRAAVHFREALRIDPGYEYARLGLVESLKARLPIYGWFLRFLLVASAWPKWVPWAIIIGYVVGMQVADRFVGDDPYAKLAWAMVRAALGLFWVLYNIADALFLLTLRFGRENRAVLSAEQRGASNVHAVLIGLIVVSLVSWPLIGWPSAIIAALLLSILPQVVTQVYHAPPGRSRAQMWCYFALTSLAGLLAMVALNPFLWLLCLLALGPAATLSLIMSGKPLAIAFVILAFFADNVREWLVAREHLRPGLR